MNKVRIILLLFVIIVGIIFTIQATHVTHATDRTSLSHHAVYIPKIISCFEQSCDGVDPNQTNCVISNTYLGQIVTSGKLVVAIIDLHYDHNCDAWYVEVFNETSSNMDSLACIQDTVHSYCIRRTEANNKSNPGLLLYNASKTQIIGLGIDLSDSHNPSGVTVPS